MIDLWLLFNLTIPFAEVAICILKSNSTSLTKVLLQTYIEYLRGLVEDSKTINHHGREHEIDLDLINGKPTQVKPAANQAFDLELVGSSRKKRYRQNQVSNNVTNFN